MQYEQARWIDLGEEEQGQALAFVPDVLDAVFHELFQACVRKEEEEEDDEAFDLGEPHLN